MELSNFQLLESSPLGTKKIASVDVTTGLLFWKKTESRKIGKECAYWFFLENGEYCPDNQAEKLERVWSFRNEFKNR